MTVNKIERWFSLYVKAVLQTESLKQFVKITELKTKMQALQGNFLDFNTEPKRPSPRPNRSQSLDALSLEPRTPDLRLRPLNPQSPNQQSKKSAAFGRGSSPQGKRKGIGCISDRRCGTASSRFNGLGLRGLYRRDRISTA